MLQILDPDDETKCEMCPYGTLPDSEHLTCVELPEEYLRLDSYWAIGAMTFALIGIILTTGILVVFIRNNDTPVVRASGRELSYVLLAGFLMCYGLTFILMQKPTTVICGIQEFLIGLCFRYNDNCFGLSINTFFIIQHCIRSFVDQNQPHITHF